MTHLTSIPGPRDDAAESPWLRLLPTRSYPQHGFSKALAAGHSSGSFHPSHFRILSRWFACTCLILSALGESRASPTSRSGSSAVVSAQEGACVSTGPDTLAYSIRICLVEPSEGAELAGDVIVSGTVTVEWGAAPPIKHVQFYFTQADRGASAAVLRDFIEPYSFTLPTERWTDGAYRLEINVVMEDLFESPLAGINVAVANEITRLPRSTGRWIAKNADDEGPIVVAVVGDGAGGLPASYDVTELIEGWDSDMILYLGDTYHTGSYTEFVNYYEPTFGSMKDITNPVPGDHEGGRQFQGYLDY